MDDLVLETKISSDICQCNHSDQHTNGKREVRMILPLRVGPGLRNQPGDRAGYSGTYPTMQSANMAVQLNNTKESCKQVRKTPLVGGTN